MRVIQRGEPDGTLRFFSAIETGLVLRLAMARIRRRIGRAGWRDVAFTVPLVGDHWRQVSEQRMSSGGTAIPQTNATAMVRATLDHIEQGVMIFDVMARLTHHRA